MLRESSVCGKVFSCSVSQLPHIISALRSSMHRVLIIYYLSFYISSCYYNSLLFYPSVIINGGEG